MSLETAVSILHAGGSGLWSRGVDSETTTPLGSILSDQSAISRDNTACSTRRGTRKGVLTKARLLYTQLAGCGQRASALAVVMVINPNQKQTDRNESPPINKIYANETAR